MTQSDDESLGYLLYQVMSVLRPQVVTELRPLGLGLPEFVCLRILSRHPGLTSAELARGTNVSAQAMNRLLLSLEDRGAVTRPATVPTGQPMPAQLTQRGKALLKRANAAVHEADQQVLTRLTPADQQQLKRLLYAAGNPATDDASPTCARTEHRPAT